MVRRRNVLMGIAAGIAGVSGAFGIGSPVERAAAADLGSDSRDHGRDLRRDHHRHERRDNHNHDHHQRNDGRG